MRTSAIVLALCLLFTLAKPVLATEVDFFQVDFNLDGVYTPDSDWGVVELSFTGSDSILYLNLNANGSWQIQNIPVLTVDSLGKDQSQHFHFDLGNSVGNNVDSLTYGYTLTTYTLGGPPTGGLGATVENYTVALYTGTKPGQVGPVPPAAAPLVGGAVADPVQHKHTNFPNQQCGPYECAPTAVSNSLQFLNRVHNLGMDASDITIAEMKDATNCEADGCWIDHDDSRPEGQRNAWWEDKAEHMRENGLPISTRKVDAANIGDIADALDRGEDVEAELDGHTVCIIGITDLGGGKYSVTIAHDDDQDDGTKATVVETGTWDSNTGTWGGALAGYGLNYFIIESPREIGARTHSSTQDPGTTPPPEEPWEPVGEGGVPFPDDVGGKIWIGKNNLYWETNEKHWTLTLTGADADKYGVSSVHGYTNEDPPTEVPVGAVTGIKDVAGPPKQRIFTGKFVPQPEWEVIEIVRTDALMGGKSATMSVRIDTHCSQISTSSNTLWVDDGWFGTLGDTLLVTEVVIFPDNALVDILGEHTFTAPVESGEWYYEFVYADPEGEPRPQGGVRWFTYGAGLWTENTYSMSLVMAGYADSSYSYYALDGITGDYRYFRLTAGEESGIRDLPIGRGGALALKAYPNPANNTARIAYTVAQSGRLSIRIYDVQGRLVRTLVEGAVAAGPGEVIWDGKTDDGRMVSAGIYMFRAETAGTSVSGSIVMLK
jgi:hypothetical protein